MPSFKLPALQETDFKLALKYLGIRSSKVVTTDYLPLIKKVYPQVQNMATPRVHSTLFACEQTKEGFYSIPEILIVDKPLIFQSHDLSQMMTQCHHILLIGITLGPRLDQLSLRLQTSDPTQALYLDALASVQAEALLNNYLAFLKKQKFKDEFLSAPYSCGYGDLSINYQPIILNLLDANKQLGITLNASQMMNPIKSITSIVGISSIPQRPLYSCLNCKRPACVPNCRFNPQNHPEGDINA